MEFVNLGARCDVDTCRQQDFLPFVCDACGNTYCREHRSYSEHQCLNAPNGKTVFTCPVCSRGVDIIPGEDPNMTWTRHSESGECRPSTKPKCPAPRCKTTLKQSNSVECNRCHQKFCLKHRYSDQHNCAHPLERKAQMGFRCKRCSMVFGKSLELINHLKQQHVQK